MPSLPITAVFVDFRYLFSSSLYRLPEATRPNGILPAPETNLMRLFFVCALCLILVGCSHPPARGIVQTCTSQGCFTRTAATTPIEPKRAAFRPRVKITTVKSKKAGMAANKPAAAKPRNPTKLVKKKANSGKAKKGGNGDKKATSCQASKPNQACERKSKLPDYP